MHELAVTEAILEVVLKAAERESARRVVTVNLTIGEFSDLKEEWIQRYFDHLARGTAAENARIAVATSVPNFVCDACGKEFSRSLRGVERVECPACRSRSCTLTGGMDYRVENVEIEE
ncbi:MAG: hydrogenase maturation nickel metallochaperone HypA [Spirochaetota bacterium]